MNTNLINFKRVGHPYKLTLMIDDQIFDLLKGYSKDHRITMSCLVENLIFTNLGGEKNGTANL